MLDLFSLFEKKDTASFMAQTSVACEGNAENDFWDEFLNEFAIDTAVTPEDYHCYLSKGEKILSLVREKKRRENFSATGSIFLKLFSSASISARENSSYDLFKYLSDVVAKKVVKPALEELSVVMLNGNREQPDYGRLKKLFGKVAPVISSDVDWTSSRLLQQFLKRNDPPAAVMLENNEGNQAALTLEGKIGKRKRNRGYRFRGEKSGYRVFTDYFGISHSALYSEIDKLFQERIYGLSQEELMQDVVYRSTYECLMKRLLIYTGNSGLVISNEVYEKYPGFLNFLEESGIEACPLPKAMTAAHCKELFGVYPLKEEDIAYYAPFDEMLPRSRYLQSNFGYMDHLQEVYMILFMLIYNDWSQEEQTRRYMRELNGSARVFETKRNIPDKYLKAMAESKFNDYFGYVEIDEECNLESIVEIEKEFIAMKHECFGMDKHDNVSIRFRKLGRHRALGLYFPKRMCLCVDIRCPSSMGHEYLHMVDYKGGELSGKYNFLKIRECYKGVLKDFIASLPSDDPLRNRLEGSTKYNLNYYLEPTEVFARCGELYFTKLRGVDNSLLRPSYNFAYPADSEELMCLIDEYYGELFGVLKGEGDKGQG